nr:DUF3883 domain-containing protein [uncultured Albidiferax sp.]
MEWSREEVEAIVADYLHMLTMELAGQKFNKTQHRRSLQTKLSGRSEASIEFKHCNISAAMVDLGFPGIRGYLPRANYQALLPEVIALHFRGRTTLDDVALAAVEQPAIVPMQIDFSKVKSEAPRRQHQVKEAEAPSFFRAVKRDYLEQEARNQSLGLAGEEFVTHYEHWRLIALGQPRLADKVEHVSQTQGDGLGYDVLSYETSGQERLIEVKTTTFGRDTPFFISRRELTLSQTDSRRFHLYRLFEFRNMPRLFDLPGALNLHCVLDPVTYRASFG